MKYIYFFYSGIIITVLKLLWREFPFGYCVPALYVYSPNCFLRLSSWVNTPLRKIRFLKPIRVSNCNEMFRRNFQDIVSKTWNVIFWNFDPKNCSILTERLLFEQQKRNFVRIS